MADDRDPFQQLLDLVVYAPIGLVTLAQKELPQLIATGRTRLDNQLTLAKFVGKMAVKKGRNGLERRLQAAEKARERDVISSPLTPDTDADTDTIGDLHGATLPTVILEAVSDELQHPHTSSADDAPPSDELPVEGYDSLAASQVVLRLGSLTMAELDAVRRYETEHRNRRTILGKISQLQAKRSGTHMDPVVRPADHADVEVLADLANLARAGIADVRGGALRLAECAPVDDWSALIAAQDHRVFVGVLDDVVLGFLVMWLAAGRDRSIVTQVFVHEGARELGLGDTMVEHAIAATRAAGLAGIESTALPGDRETKNLFERAGLTARKITVYMSLPVEPPQS